MAKRVTLRDARGRFAAPQARVRVFSDGNELFGAARSSTLKSRKRVRRAKTRKRKLRARPPARVSEGIPLPGRIHPDIQSGFRKFIMPVRQMPDRVKRQAFVMIRLDEPRYKPGKSDQDIIIPIRLGSFTRKQLEKMTMTQLDAIASTHPKYSKATEVLGVYVRKG